MLGVQLGFTTPFCALLARHFIGETLPKMLLLPIHGPEFAHVVPHAIQNAKNAIQTRSCAGADQSESSKPKRMQLGGLAYTNRSGRVFGIHGSQKAPPVVG